MMECPRAEHMAWCKARALAYLPDDPTQAFLSFASDLGKHSETDNHAALMLGMAMLMGGHLSTAEQMREFIDGAN